MFRDVTDKLRTLGDRALSSTAGDRFRPVKVLREVLGTANDLVGRPLCTDEELRRRRTRRQAASTAIPAASAPAREAAPVMVYFAGRDQRTLKKVEELLAARGVPYKVLDCSEDEATRSWVGVQTHGGEDYPYVFIAGELVGGLRELVRLDVNGALKRRVFGG